jgi:hypothetical protein
MCPLSTEGETRRVQLVREGGGKGGGGCAARRCASAAPSRPHVPHHRPAGRGRARVAAARGRAGARRARAHAGGARACRGSAGPPREQQPRAAVQNSGWLLHAAPGGPGCRPASRAKRAAPVPCATLPPGARRSRAPRRAATGRQRRAAVARQGPPRRQGSRPLPVKLLPVKLLYVKPLARFAKDALVPYKLTAAPAPWSSPRAGWGTRRVRLVRGEGRGVST